MDMSGPNQSVFKTCFNGKVKKVRNQIISCYYLDQVCDATQRLNCNHYVVGAGYKQGDCQIGITGSVSKIFEGDKWVEEDPSITAGREMMEEVGIAPVERLKNYTTIKCGRITMYVFLVDANKCRPVTKKEAVDSLNVNTQYVDIKTKKVLVLIHGTKKVLTELLVNIKYQIYSTDKTVYVGMLPVKKIPIWKDFFNRELKGKNTKFPKFRESDVMGCKYRSFARKKHCHKVEDNGWITVSYSR